MKLMFIRSAGFACLLLIGASATAPLHATNINSSMLECNALQPSQNDVQHTELGTSTDGIFPNDRWVTCSVPRAPLPVGATSGLFYVMGNNIDGMRTSLCTLSSYEFTGTFLGSISFATSSAHYTQALYLPSAQLGYWAYTSLSCLLPADARATVDSVIAVQ